VDNELEVIRSEMEETRSSLADKVETLETQIREKVHDTTTAVTSTVTAVKETVAETVDNVKQAVAGTVETVKDALNIKKHVQEHPWASMGGAVAVGAIVGWMTTPSRRREESRRERRPEPRYAARHGNGAPNGAHHEPPVQEEEGTFGSAMQTLKGLAIGSVMGVLRQMISRAAPSNLTGDLTRLVDDVTQKLGGKPLADIEESQPHGGGSGVGSSRKGDESTREKRPEQVVRSSHKRSGNRGRR
jgi:ElaB/YqjD/DUF883 family membrane-anchored ribosome-binding protein